MSQHENDGMPATSFHSGTLTLPVRPVDCVRNSTAMVIGQEVTLESSDRQSSDAAVTIALEPTPDMETSTTSQASGTEPSVREASQTELITSPDSDTTTVSPNVQNAVGLLPPPVDEDAYPSVSKVTLRRLHVATADKRSAINWCREHGLLSLSKGRRCICGRDLLETVCIKKKDGYRLRCRDCKCRKEISIREGSFFGMGTHLDVTTILDLLYLYSYQMSSTQILYQECQVASESLIRWRNNIRGVYAQHLLNHSSNIGGFDRVVEVDESAFVGRRLRVYRKEKKQWVLGGIDTQTKEGFLVTINDRKDATLLEIITNYIYPGTIIVSDLFKAYKTNKNASFEFVMDENQLSFVDPKTYRKTNRVDKMWCTVKHKPSRKADIRRSVQSSQFIEYIWRQKFGSDPFENLLKHLRECFPLPIP